MALIDQKKARINKELSKTKSFLIKQRLVETLSSSTIHGLPNIVRSDKYITQFIWLVCFLVSSAGCFCLVAESIFAYLKFDVTTTVRIIDEPFSEFPRIMFCDKNNLNTNYSLEQLRNISNENLFNNSISLFQKKINSEKLKSNLISFMNNLTREESSRVGQMLHEILISCKFSGSECKPSDFEWFLHPYNGICHIFNAGKNFSNNNEAVPLKVSHKPGYFNGLEIELYLGKRSKLKEPSYGLQLIITNHSESFVSNLFMNIPVGFEVNVQLDRIFVNQLPYPYSNCKIDSRETLESFDSPLTRFFSGNTTYKHSHCLEYCFQLSILEECKCSEYKLDASLKSKICLNESEVNCVYEYYEKVFVKNDFIQRNCIPLCPYECHRLKIRKGFSTNKYPSDDYLDVLKNDLYLKENVFKSDNWTHIKDNILKMNIFYEELSYTSITENPSMTIVDLISNIGGTMGLFLGISFLSVIEIVEVVVEIFYVLGKRK